jgi:hypothetical protein
LALIYIPALVRALYNYISASKVGSYNNLWKDKYDVSWWTSNGIFHHPYLLVSYWYEGQVSNWREISGVMDDVEVLGDCGAYSAVSQGVHLDPLKVVEWQINNSEIGLTLDEIPAKVDRSSQAGATKVRSLNFEEFKDCAKRSRRNYEIAIERAKKDNLPLYAIMHGDTREKWDYWWSLIRDLPVSGYGTGLKPTTNAVLQMSCLAKLHSEGVRSAIHLLGVSGTNVIPALAWASKHFSRVTFDSMSYAQGSISKMYMLFKNFTREIRGFGATDAYKPHPVGHPMPCNCPICSEVENPNLFRDIAGERHFGNRTMSGLLISLHNLFQYNEYIHMCAKLAKECDTADQMIKELEHTRSEEAIAGIRFWEDYMNRGIDKALFMWREKLTAKLEKDHDYQLELFK